MGVTEEILRLKYETDADQRLPKLRAMLADVRQELDKQNDQWERGVIDAKDYSKALDKLTSDQKQLEKAIRQTGDAARAVGTRGGGGGAAVLELSRAFEDAQYGVQGVLNNIPTLVSALGGAAGVAGSISLIAVAVTQLLRYAPDLKEMFSPQDLNLFGETLATLKKRLDELTEKEYRLEVDASAVDDARQKLEKAEEALKRYDAISKQQTSLQQESGRRASEAIAERGGATDTLTGGQNLQQAVRDLMLGQGEPAAQRKAAEAAVARAKARYEAEKADPFNATPESIDAAIQNLNLKEKALKDLVAKQKGEAATAASGLIGGASGGNEADIIRLQQMLMQNEGFFGGRGVDRRLIGDLAGARPGFIADERQARENLAAQEHDRQMQAQLAREKEQAAQKAEQEQKRAEAERERAKQERDRAALEAERAAAQAAQPFVQGATPEIQAQLAGGAAPEDVAAALMVSLQKLGVTMEQAFELSARAVDEVDAKVRADMAKRFGAGAAAANRRQAVLMQNMNDPWLNNRPGWP